MLAAKTTTVLRCSFMFLLVQERVNEYIFGMSSNFLCFIVLIIISALATRTSSRTMETANLINSLQRPIIMTHSFPTMIKSMQDDPDDNEDRFCQIEYQVTRKRTGKCVKLGHKLNGCVSGDYMNPFHPDCF